MVFSAFGALVDADDWADGGDICVVVDFGTVLPGVEDAMADSSLRLSTNVFLVLPVPEVVGASTVLSHEVVSCGLLAGDCFLFGTSLASMVGALFLLSVEVRAISLPFSPFSPE